MTSNISSHVSHLFFIFLGSIQINIPKNVKSDFFQCQCLCISQYYNWLIDSGIPRVSVHEGIFHANTAFKLPSFDKHRETNLAIDAMGIPYNLINSCGNREESDAIFLDDLLHFFHCSKVSIRIQWVSITAKAVVLK